LCHFEGRFGFTGSLTTGADTAPAFTGTVNNDTYTAQASDTVAATDTFNVIDTIEGGAGVDKFVFTSATGATFFATSAGTAAVAKITDFVAGTDKFSLITTGTALYQCNRCECTNCRDSC
jgi:hypothetical protein